MPQLYNNALDDDPIYERCETFTGGVDDFSRSTLLPPDVSQKLTNVIADDSGVVKVRPGADPLGSTVLSAGQRVQCVTYFDTPTYERVYAAINASLRSWNGATWSTVGSYPFGVNTIQAMAQGADKLYCSDASGQWYYYDGAAWSSALGSGATDAPNGANMMIWHSQRMFAVKPSAPDTIYVSDLGDATSTHWPVANSFRVGRGEGEAIKGWVSYKGFGLVVLKEGSVYLVDADPSITVANWGIYRISNSVGCVAGKTVVAVADQVFFLAKDGIRAVTATDGTDTPYEISPPLSQPVNSYIKRINWSYANKACGWQYGAFVLFALPLDSATEPNTVIVFNLRTGKWNGAWTGWTPTAFATSRFSGVERLIFGDSAGYVNEWKDYASEDLSATYTDNSVAIASAWRSRSFNFQEPVNWKDPMWAEWRFQDSSGSATLKVWLDGSEARQWTDTLANTTNALPLFLPFDLAVIKPKTIAKRLDGLPEFNEAFIEVEATAGKWVLKNATMAAFLNTHQDES